MTQLAASASTRPDYRRLAAALAAGLAEFWRSSQAVPTAQRRPRATEGTDEGARGSH